MEPNRWRRELGHQGLKGTQDLADAEHLNCYGLHYYIGLKSMPRYSNENILDDFSDSKYEQIINFADV